MPFWTSFLVRTFAWMILLGRNGVVNRLLISLGITDAPLSLVFNWTGVMIGMVHAMMPLAILTMLSVMERIDLNLPSAARTLGARGGQAFWRIYFRALAAGRRGGRAAGVHHRARLLHHPGAARRPPADDDRAGHHRRRSRS